MSQPNSTIALLDRERGQHLKFEDRCSIRIYKKLDYSLREIAKAIDCSPATVLNELKRGTGGRNGSCGRFPEYSAKRGQQSYENNRSRCHRDHVINEAPQFIEWMVRQVKERKWSLDACVGYARLNNLFPDDEFVRLSELEQYGVMVYYAHPYSSWERAQNERHNRIFRRYVPKGVSIENYTADQILQYSYEMNALPRKRLGYHTPEELFDEFLDGVYALKSIQVA